MTSVEKLKKRGIVPRAVLYARFSSDMQREESIDAQLRAMHSFCESSGIVVVDEYCDRARSATTDDRPEFLRMIAESGNGEFDFVIVHKYDRFARNRYNATVYKHELNCNGVGLISVLEQIDDSPEGIILESVLDGMSEYYSKNLAREVRKGLNENALNCIRNGGRPPLGFMVDEETKRYVVNEKEAPAVRLIFDGIVKGKTYTQIIKELNLKGYLTRNGNKFGKNSINDIVRNEKYKGVYVFNRAAAKRADGKRNNHASKHEDEIVRIEGGVEAIVSAETFDKVARIIASRRRSTPTTAKETYLLAGRVFCGECGRSYTGNRHRCGRNKDIYVTYRCGSKNVSNETKCGNKEISRDKLEAFVLDELAKVIFSDSVLEKIEADYDDYCKKSDSQSTGEMKAKAKQLSDTKRKIDNLVTMIAETCNKSLIEKLTELEEEAEHLETELRTAKVSYNRNVSKQKIKDAYTTARRQFVSGELSERQELINQYLDKVVIYNEHIEIFLDMLPTYLAFFDRDNCGVKRQKNSRLHAKISTEAVEDGGDGGNRNRVRKSLALNFYECIHII